MLFYIPGNNIGQKFDKASVYTKLGKPMLVNNPWSFNMAHSDDWVVCAVSKREAGIDIECIDKFSLPFPNRRILFFDIKGVLRQDERLIL